MIHRGHKSFTPSLEWIFPNNSGNSLAPNPLLNISKGNYISLKEGQHYYDINCWICSIQFLVPAYFKCLWSALVVTKITFRHDNTWLWISFNSDPFRYYRLNEVVLNILFTVHLSDPTLSTLQVSLSPAPFLKHAELWVPVTMPSSLAYRLLCCSKFELRP